MPADISASRRRGAPPLRHPPNRQAEASADVAANAADFETSVCSAASLGRRCATICHRFDPRSRESRTGLGQSYPHLRIHPSPAPAPPAWARGSRGGRPSGSLDCSRSVLHPSRWIELEGGRHVPSRGFQFQSYCAAQYAKCVGSQSQPGDVTPTRPSPMDGEVAARRPGVGLPVDRGGMDLSAYDDSEIQRHARRLALAAARRIFGGS